MKRLKPQQLELIEWDDSYGGGTWFDDEEYKPRLAKTLSVGFVIRETKKSLTITSGISTNGLGQLYSPLTIPKSCILSREVLRAKAEVAEAIKMKNHPSEIAT